MPSLIRLLIRAVMAFIMEIRLIHQGRSPRVEGKAGTFRW